MSIKLSIPGKTFLAGEYLALEGGPALLAMTGPRFVFRVSTGQGVEGIHPQSPAGRYIARNQDFFAGFKVTFEDPRQGSGGWGASTAQYLSVFALHHTRGAVHDDTHPELDSKLLLENYRQDSWDGQGLPPSGADLIGQLKGGLTFFEKRSGQITASGAWPFDDLEGFLIPTGVKIPTHEHLRILQESDFSDLGVIMESVRNAWKAKDSDAFARGIDAYGKRLAKRGLTLESTLSLLHDLAWQDGVRAAKGCGAQGADVVFALVEKLAVPGFRRWLEEQGLNSFCLRESLSDGLSRQVDSTADLFPPESP